MAAEQLEAPMHSILAIAGSAGFILSFATAALARAFPDHCAAMQDWAGGLIIGSAIFMVAGFPLV